MEIPLNVEVECADGRCGRSTFVIVDPVTQEVTHLVVRDERRPHTERLVPARLIADSNHEEITLRCTQQEWQRMEPFYITEFVRAAIPHYEVTSQYMWPDVTTRTTLKWIPETYQNLPPHTRDVRRGAYVQATDGRVGRVDEFLVDPRNHHINHLVMREGRLWGQKDVSIPVAQIDRIEEDTVYLKLDKAGVEKLPAIPLHRPLLNLA
jgi:sporulation protein YlmC with PRC-barrel domain